MPVDPPSIQARNKYQNGTLGMATMHKSNRRMGTAPSYNAASELQETAGLQMDTKTSKCVHLVEGGTNGPQYVNMAPMGKTSLGRVIHARKRQKTSFTKLETHGDGSGYLACDTCYSGVPNEIVPAGIVPIGNILVGNNIGFQTRTKGGRVPPGVYTEERGKAGH